MARARNIKPAFFDNEDLAELIPQYRLLFIGLWCLADREGRLECRPKKIKASLFPYEDCNVVEALMQLSEKNLISMYSINENSYIQVVKFTEHQKPHGTEKDSVIPSINGYLTVNKRSDKGLINGEPDLIYVGDTIKNSNLDKITVKHTLDNVELMSDNALIPDSLILIPDSKPPVPAQSLLTTTVEANLNNADLAGVGVYFE